MGVSLLTTSLLTVPLHEDVGFVFVAVFQETILQKCIPFYFHGSFHEKMDEVTQTKTQRLGSMWLVMSH